MAIYINGRFLEKNLTGIQRYAMEVTKQLDALNCKEDIILLVSKKCKYNLNFKNIKVQHLNFLTDNLWEQITMPLYLLFKRKSKLLNMCNSAPVLKPGYVVLHDISFKTRPEHLTKAFIMWYSFITRLNIRRYKKIFTVSNFSKKEIMDTYKVCENKIAIAYPSAENVKDIKVDNSVLKELNLKKGKFVFSLGSKSEHKNHQFIVKMALKNPNVTFVVSGMTNNRVLKNGISSNIEAKNIINTGYISDEKLMSLYHNCKMFIFPSLYEGFGLPPLEAISCGCKTIVVNDLQVFHEVYGNSVNYLDCTKDGYDLKEIEKKFHTISKDILKKYSWKITAQKIFEVIENDK